MKNSIEFVKLLDKSLLADYAKNLTECENKYPKNIAKELNCIAVYFCDYQGGHYDFEQTIRFDDFGYRINYQPVHIANEIHWMGYVSKNLPKGLRQDYVEQCKKYLQERKENDILPEDDVFLNKQ